MKMATTERVGCGGLRRVAATLALLAAILLAAGFLAARTAGGSAYIREWIGRRLGLEIDAERVRVAWPYVLVLENVASAGGEADAGPALRAREVRLGLPFRGRWNVAVREGALRLREAADGAWGPGALGRLAPFNPADCGRLSRLTSGIRRRVAFDLRRCDVAWTDAAGVEIGAARGMDFALTPVRVPGRRLYHYALTVRALSGDGWLPRELRMEWLSGDGIEDMAVRAAPWDEPRARPPAAPGADAEDAGEGETF